MSKLSSIVIATISVCAIFALTGCDYMKLGIGASAVRTTSNDLQYRLKEKEPQIAGNISLATKIDDYFVSLNTNRYLDVSSYKEAKMKDKTIFVKNTFTNDALSIFRKIGNTNLYAGAIVTNSKLETKIKGLNKDTKHFNLFGAGISAQLFKNVMINSFYILPNKEAKLGHAFGVSATYFIGL